MPKLATEGAVPSPDTHHLADGIFVGTADIAEAASGEYEPILEDDALNISDRGLGAYSTVIELLELVGVEIAGGMGLFAGGIVMQLVMFQRMFAIADAQQFEAAKSMGVVFAYFAIARAADRRPLPARVTPADVEREVAASALLKSLRANRSNWRGSTPQSLLDAGEREGIELALKALNSNLGQEQERARQMHEQMILRARIDNMDKPAEEQARIERQLRDAYPVQWWASEIRQRTYEAFVKAVKPQALAVYARFSGEGGSK